MCCKHVINRLIMARTLHERVKQRDFESLRQKATVHLLVTAAHYRQILNDICREFGITHDQYNILRILKGVHPEGHPRYEIIDRMIERRPDVTRLLNRLEKRALVTRKTSSQDRRLSIAVITKKGLNMLKEMHPHFVEAANSFTRQLSENELETFSENCNKLLETL